MLTAEEVRKSAREALAQARIAPNRQMADNLRRFAASRNRLADQMERQEATEKQEADPWEQVKAALLAEAAKGH